MLSIKTRGKAESISCPTVNQLAMEEKPWSWRSGIGRKEKQVLTMAEGDMERDD